MCDIFSEKCTNPCTDFPLADCDSGVCEVINHTPTCGPSRGDISICSQGTPVQSHHLNKRFCTSHESGVIQCCDVICGRPLKKFYH